MNFFAHATVALWRSEQRSFVFGAMLPDLTAMLGLRPPSSSDAELNAGIAFHHATDAAFHASGRFLGLCTRGVAGLSAAGVGRGSARAVAHVGVELLLDGRLSHDRRARAAYSHVLKHAIDAELSHTLQLPDDQARERLNAGLVRLLSAPIPEAYLEPAFVVDRLRAILARRPRLALQPGDLPHVQAFIDSAHAEVAEDWPEIMAQVRAGLAQ